jgi:hypothetical protein
MGDRDDEKAGHFQMTMVSGGGASDDPDVICAAADTVRPVVGDLQRRQFQFRPPGQIRWHTYFKNQVSLFSCKRCRSPALVAHISGAWATPTHQSSSHA